MHRCRQPVFWGYDRWVLYSQRQRGEDGLSRSCQWLRGLQDGALAWDPGALGSKPSSDTGLLSHCGLQSP